MSYTSSRKGTSDASFLASGEGIWTQTRTIPAALGEPEGTEKIVRKGTIFPANDSTAEGIIYENVYVTDGDHAGAVMLAGRVYADRLPESPTSAAQTAMEKTGIVFLEKAPVITRE